MNCRMHHIEFFRSGGPEILGASARPQPGWIPVLLASRFLSLAAAEESGDVHDFDCFR